jgi:hypothetical protein
MKSASADLETRARQVRALVASRQYAAARDAFAEYCRVLREILSGLPPPAARRRLYQDWRRLWSETRLQVLAGRAHAAARLARLPGRRCPYGDRPAPPPAWRYLA